MFKIYNADIINTKQRFRNACLYSIPAAIVLGIIYGWFSSFMYIEFEIAFVGLGYLIGWIVKEAGHGVHVKFSILGAILALLCFVISDTISIFGIEILTNPLLLITMLPSIFISYFTNIFTFNGFLSILFRAAGIYYAYYNSRIV